MSVESPPVYRLATPEDLVRAGAVDAFASDYVPSSLVEAAFQCARDEGISLHDAIAMISDHPAQMSGLGDRGRLESGLRADVVRVHLHGALPIVRQVWRAGERVAVLRASLWTTREPRARRAHRVPDFN